MNYYEIRKNDETRAEKVAAFIDQNVYCRAKDKIQRITDKELQLKGVDLMWNSLRIDEKMAINYINQSLPTFAFELSALNNKNGDGWFLESPFNITDDYFLGYLMGDIWANRYDSVEIIQINKAKLWRYLKNIGFDLSIVQKIRSNKVVPNKISANKNKTYYIGLEGLKIVHSSGMLESPINLIINKSILYQLCSNVILYKDGRVTTRASF